MQGLQSSETRLQLGIDDETFKWSWACRILGRFNYNLDMSTDAPRAGDLGLFRVKNIGYHSTIVCTNNKKLRIYDGDQFVGVFGNRYATDALEGEVISLENLSLLTAAGMAGTVKSKHRGFGKTTDVEFVGYLSDDDGRRVNLKELKFQKTDAVAKPKNLVIVVGTGMNSGKTTSARLLIKSLSDRKLRVAACKLTGSVSNRDQDEMRSAAAAITIDFSDYGFPSTYLCPRQELLDLFNTMISDLLKADPDIIVMEIADGVLQRETAMLIEDPSIKDVTRGIILSADSSTSALYATEVLKKAGHSIVAVTGSITSAPLFVKEFKQSSDIPVLPSFKSGDKLADAVIRFING